MVIVAQLALNLIVSIELNKIAEDLISQGFNNKVKLKGFVRDATGREYISKEIIFDPQEWI